jgi:predicted SAM-dependent methyltransferase
MKPTRATDYVCDLTRGVPCPPNAAERIETYHVIEHIPHPQVHAVVQDWFRVLQPGGTLVIECPDLDEGVRRYLDGDEDMLGSIYGLQRYPGDTHFYGYNVKRLTSLLTSIGFAKVEEGPARDYHALTEPCLRVEARK